MENETALLDRLIAYLIKNKTSPTYVKLRQDDLLKLCDIAIRTLQKDKTLLQITAPITVCGDVHGQFTDLMKFLDAGGPFEMTNYLFLGDYVDRGSNSVATLTMLLCIKCRYPDHIWLLRGNHETRDISRLYGFLDEIEQNYEPQLWERFNDVFSYLPLAAVISDRIFCVHGGLSKDLSSLQDIESIKRPYEVPEIGMVCDLLWADPLYDSNGYVESERGTSYTFGADVAQEFLEANDFDLICRAHQVVSDGFEFPFYPQQSVVTVFSAPNYCDEFGNKGAMLKIDSELTCSFVFVDPPSDNGRHEVHRPVTPAAPHY